MTTDNILWLEQLAGFSYPADIRPLLTELISMEKPPRVQFYINKDKRRPFTLLDFRKLDDIRFKTFVKLRHAECELNPYAIIARARERDPASFCLPLAYNSPGVEYIVLTPQTHQYQVISLYDLKARPHTIDMQAFPLFDGAAVLAQVRQGRNVLVGHRKKLRDIVNASEYTTVATDIIDEPADYGSLLSTILELSGESFRLTGLEAAVQGKEITGTLAVNGIAMPFTVDDSSYADLRILHPLNDVLKQLGSDRRFCVCIDPGLGTEACIAFATKQQYGLLKEYCFLDFPTEEIDY